MKTYTSPNNMSIRADHTTAAPKIGALPPNTQATGEEVYQSTGELWLHITSPMDGWIAAVHNGETLGTITDGTPVTPPAVSVRAIVKAVVTWQGDDGKTYQTEVFPKQP